MHMTTCNRSNFLLIDIYNSAVMVTVYKKGEQIFSDVINFPHLKVKDPRSESLRNSIEKALDKITAVLQEKSSISLKKLKILVVPHGDILQIKNYELYIKLPKAQKLDAELIKQIIHKQTPSQESFQNLIDANDKVRKVTSVVRNISPMYYKIKQWEGKEVDKLFFAFTKQYINKDIHKVISDIPLPIDTATDLYYINPALIYTAYLHQSSLLMDPGFENIYLYQTYDGAIVSSLNFKFGLNDLLRKLEKALDLTYELALTELQRFLQGRCKGNLCSKIEKELQNFEESIDKAIFKMQNAKAYLTDTHIIDNPQMPAEILIWLKQAINKEGSAHLDTYGNSNINFANISDILCYTYPDFHEKDILILN